MAIKEPTPQQAGTPGAVALQRVMFDVTGMTCANCSARIERTLRKQPGVKEANVNLAPERASVALDPTVTSPEKLIAAIKDVGYGATARQENQPLRIELDLPG